MTKPYLDTTDLIDWLQNTSLTSRKPRHSSMLKTNLKYFDYRTLKLYNVYVDKESDYYIRRGNHYEWVDKYDVFDLAKMPKFNHTNLVRYLRKWIKIYDERVDSCHRKNDDWNMNRAIGSRDAFESVLKYILKMQEE